MDGMEGALRASSPSMVELQIRKVDGYSSFTVNVLENGTIGNVKTAIAKADGTVAYQQQLLDMSDLIRADDEVSGVESAAELV
jgi:hypothetical protein